MSDNGLSPDLLTNPEKNMPYALAVGDIIQVSVHYFQENIVQMINTFHYRLASPSTLPDGAAALTQFLDSYFNDSSSDHWPFSWKFLASQDVAVSQVRAQRIHPLRNVPVVALRNILGTITTAALPGVVQWSISENGDFARKGGSGGVRVPGLTGLGVSNSRLTPTFQTAAIPMATFCETPKAVPSPTSATFQPVIFNRAAPATSQDVTNAVVQETVRSQRTRVAFRGI